MTDVQKATLEKANEDLGETFERLFYRAFFISFMVDSKTISGDAETREIFEMHLVFWRRLIHSFIEEQGDKREELLRSIPDAAALMRASLANMMPDVEDLRLVSAKAIPIAEKKLEELFQKITPRE
jgi:hypothetical protein